MLPCSIMSRLLLLFSISAVTLLVDPIAGQPSAHDGHHQHRRSPMGFQGVRGKRSTDKAGVDNNFEETVNSTSPDGSLSGGSEEGETPERINGPVLGQESRHFLGALPALSLTKRAPVGFMGMRGKKDSELMETLPFAWSSAASAASSVSDGEEEEEPQFNNYPANLYSATRTQHPQDDEEEEEGGDEGQLNRGNEIDLDSYENEEDDFLLPQEPRNKKLFFNLPYRFIPKRAPSGFMGMRGKKLVDRSWKRGPSGFMGMRGKKSYGSPLMNLLKNYDLNEDSDLHAAAEKRGPSGFVGSVRGKKWNDIVDEYLQRLEKYGSAKRAPKMGFHGMRGKRSPFFNGGMEDRRTNNYGMFNVMKKPYEFRGKFVGVRGKKSDSAFLDNGLDGGPMMGDKRSPSGFMGMRGKKS